MKEYILKDKILKTILRGDTDKKDTIYTVKTVSEYLKADYHYVFYCCEIMLEQGYIKMFTLNPTATDRVISLTHKGKVFLNQAGGYIRKNRQEKISFIYTITTIAMTAISTLAIIILTYFNYKATDKANDNVEVERKLKNVIATQAHKIDSLAKMTVRIGKTK